ncbi:oxygen-regulated protein 1 [Clarias gariepinus]|uniref:oxygen-regulated protein 1 n=1 Tax=Clarias gariepinus TaxID=13013 RepID=UPI00234CBE17|nr:oxygen-regulated protein 1 [Clarias gariepinus]
MNTPPHHEPQQPDVFMQSTQISPSKLLFSSKESKRVCFYKSEDPHFSGHWLVINSRKFKTFDALLDALSSKVPLPFGVRTITTPKGRHTIQSLDQLQHGASYMCSDQRKVKPLNLDEIKRTHAPWNSVRPSSTGRQGRRGLIRQLVKKNEVGRMAKKSDSSVTVWTSKRMVVFKNRDPSTKHVVVLQRRTAPNFEALLEYLSQVMQFPVVKLYTANGRRVEGLSALILCSDVIVAAGNEPFQLANFNFQASTQPSHLVISESTVPTKTQPLPQVPQKSSRPRSRNFSLSSEKYFVNQLNMSLNGSHSGENEKGKVGSLNKQTLESEEMSKCDFMSGTEERTNLIMPSDDEIEKSFRVNQDGSMTVEMKVRLTIKQEEMIHWTTSVSRTCANSQEMAAFPQPVLSYNSTDMSKIDSYESKDYSTQIYKPIKLNKDEENHCTSAINSKPCFRRLPTPGPRHVRRKGTSVKNTNRLSQTEVQESVVGTCSYVEHTTEADLPEGYCVVSHSSSSSTRPIPKPRKKKMGEAKHNRNYSSVSGMAEVLQLHNKGNQMTETVMHIYQSQDTCKNNFENPWADVDDRFEFVSQEPKKPDRQSSSNDCDTGLNKPTASSYSGNARNNKCNNLLSGQSDLSQAISNHASSFTNYENHAGCEPSINEVDAFNNEDSKNKKKLCKKPKMAQKSEQSNKHKCLKCNKTQKGSVPDFLKDLKNSGSPERQSCTESDNYGQTNKKTKKGQSPKKVQTCHCNTLRDTSQNLGCTHILRPHMKEELDIILSSHSAPFHILTKHRSVNGSKTKSPKESKELSESVSMPVLHSSPYNVHEYVKNWLEKNHPESVSYMDELDLHESRARFQIESDFSDITEMRSELDKDNLVESCASFEGSAVSKPVSQHLRCGREPMDTQILIRSCKSVPSVRMHAAKQELGAKNNRSSENLVPQLPDTKVETTPNTQLNPGSSMKDVLEQLCLSSHSIRRACSHSHLSSLKKMKKSSSLPDFSSQIASVVGSRTNVLLYFLTMMPLRNEITNFTKDSSSANANNSGCNPEALQVIQSLQKLASIEDEEVFTASLASLLNSTSAPLKKSCRDFQKKNNFIESPPLSSRPSEQESALEVNSEDDYKDKGHIFGIREVMDNLNMCEDLRREISSLVSGDLTNFYREKNTKEHVGYENENTSESIACENENGTLIYEPGKFLGEERRYLEARESQYDDITNTVCSDFFYKCKELRVLESSSPKPAILNKELSMGETDIVKNVQIEDITKQKEQSRADLCEEKQEMINNVQVIGKRVIEDDISHVDEFKVLDYSPTNLEDKVEWQENVGCMQSGSELLSPVLELEAKDGISNSGVIKNSVSKRTDCSVINSKMEDAYSETREQPDITSVASETETVEAKHSNNGTIQLSKNVIEEDARSEAPDFSGEEHDPTSDDNNGPTKFDNNNDCEETMCSTSECENPAVQPQNFSLSDQDDEPSNHYKSASWTWQESETEPELQKSEEESVTKKQAQDAYENEEEEDEDEDFDAEPNSTLPLYQEGKYSDPSKAYKGTEEEAGHDIQTLEDEIVSKEKDDDKQTTALDTNKDSDTQSRHCFLEDPSTKDLLRRESCKSEKKPKAQSDDSPRIEEADMNHKCQCVHPTVSPQQLLDFVNLALKSSALVFTYDLNGCLRLEPDKCKNKAMTLTKSNVDNQYARRCLPSPNTSDLSDYRTDTSDGGGDPSQVSSDLFTEGGEDEAEMLFLYQDKMEQSSENINRKAKILDNCTKKHHPNTKQIAGSNLSSINSQHSFPDSIVNSTMQNPVYCNSSDSTGNSELKQCLACHVTTEGILIDNGRWLLKEDHLIRKSPPVPTGMYENMDTTSVDTGQEITSEDAPYINPGRKPSPLTVISSSEVEEMTKPSTPKCTYFNTTHSSDSDPFLDNQSVSSNKERGFTRKSKEVSPLGEKSKMQVKKNGSLNSFASVEFKLSTGKVHPEDSMTSSVVEKTARSQRLQCNTPSEEESVQGLSFRCGQYCPIL